MDKEHQAQQDTKAADVETRPLLPPPQQQQQQQQQQELHLGQPVAEGGLRPPPGAERPPPPGAAEHGRRCRRGSGVLWFTALGFLFLTFNSGMAIYRSQGERWNIAFVVFSYVDLLLLFVSLRWYETAEPGSLTRDRLKVVIWVLTTALTLLFTTKVAAIMPALVAVVVWIMAFSTVAGGFYAFFCYSDKKP